MLLSFVLLGALERRGGGPRCAPERCIVVPTAAGTWIVRGFRALGFAVFVLILVAGIAGNQSPTRNIAPIVVWVVVWLGLPAVCALVGNIWPLIEPWTSLDRLMARCLGK